MKALVALADGTVFEGQSVGATGESVGELEILKGTHEVIKGLDSETWSELRNLFLEKKLISQSDRGEYLLCRDLHSITFCQLKEWVNIELPLDKEDIASHLSWQDHAYRLLRDQRSAQRDSLNINLAELFAR